MRRNFPLGSTIIFWIFIFLFVSLPDRNKVSSARRHLPLHGDDIFRKNQQAAECQFGKQLRELGSSWFADLGPPFGVMYCIKCECLPYQKKRRVVGKVHCRNIKNECPKPSCDEPVLAPGRCCKVCPGDLNSPDIVDDQTAIISVDDEKNTKHFAALLTSRSHTDGSDKISTGTTSSGEGVNYLATGRFSFHKRNLYYSFYCTNPNRPRGLQFVDLKGNILEEQVLAVGSVYQNRTRKICGVWRRIPREYRKLIREEKLLVTLLWDKAELTITGQLYRYRSLTTELYSVLLESDDVTMVAGGTAMVSATSTAPSLHMTVIFQGIFTDEEIRAGKEATVTVKLASLDGKTIVIDEALKLDHPASTAVTSSVEVRSAVTHPDLHLLSRLQLSLTVVNVRTGVALRGVVRTRVFCDLFQAPISAPSSEDVEVLTTPVSGMGWVFVNGAGGVDYHVLLDGAEEQNTEMIVSLVVERRLVELEDLTPSLHPASGWANGTLDSPLSVRHLEQLYANELAVNVATAHARSLVRGRLLGRPVADARDAPAPSLLLREDRASPADVVGLIWASVDVECNLHYELIISGLSSSNAHTLQLYLEEIPFVAPGAPVSRRLLEEFTSSSLEDFILGLTPQELMKLDSGVVYFNVKNAKTQQSLLRTQWKEVTIPTSCLPLYSENSLPTLNYNNDADVTGMEQTASGCYHGDRFHAEGGQWASVVDHCVMCACHGGRVTCDSVLCPPPNCPSPLLRPHQCCPICDHNAVEGNTTLGQCQLAGQTFQAGASWHPYIPPNGFDTCTTCSCNVSTLKVKCQRTECPPLNCDERTAVRKSGCCKVCPTYAQQGSVTSPVDPGWMGEQPGSVGKTKADVLAAGGCNYPIGGPFENGEEWHPRVYSHGEVKWVKCHCKDGKVRCERSRRQQPA